MLEGKKHHLLSLTLALFVFASPLGQYASAAPALPRQDDSAEVTPQRPNDPAVILSTIVDGVTPDEVTREILKQDPTAEVLVPVEAPAAKSSPNAKSDPNAKIVIQQADSLNTAITVLSYANEDRLYFISPHSLLQKGAVVLFNLYYMTRWDFKLGRWTRVMQKMEPAITKLLMKKRGMTAKKAAKISPFISHAILIYATYWAYQYIIDFNLPHWHSAGGAVGALLASLHITYHLLHQGINFSALLNALRKGAFGYFSGFGWTLLSRKWDPLKEHERPISRQAYTVFNTFRGAIVGYFVPQMVMEAHSVGIVHFALANSAFLISAAAGGVFYKWGDQILARYPKIGRGLERFQKSTEKVNQLMNRSREYVISKWNQTPCSRLLRRRAKPDPTPEP